MLSNSKWQCKPAVKISDKGVVGYATLNGEHVTILLIDRFGMAHIAVGNDCKPAVVLYDDLKQVQLI